MTFEEAIQWGRPVKPVKTDEDRFKYFNEKGQVCSSFVGMRSWDLDYYIKEFLFDTDDWTPCLWENETVGPWEVDSTKNIIKDAIIAELTEIFKTYAPTESTSCSCSKWDALVFGCKCGGS